MSGPASDRDRFARAALSGYLANPESLPATLAVAQNVKTDSDLHDAIAALCYEHADAMLRVRHRLESRTPIRWIPNEEAERLRKIESLFRSVRESLGEVVAVLDNERALRASSSDGTIPADTTYRRDRAVTRARAVLARAREIET